MLATNEIHYYTSVSLHDDMNIIWLAIYLTGAVYVAIVTYIEKPLLQCI